MVIVVRHGRLSILNEDSRDDAAPSSIFGTDSGSLAGKWWRFSKYEVEGGYLRPAKNSELIAYDPWKTYGRTEIKTRGGRLLHRPYQSLLDLAFSLGSGAAVGGATDAELDAILGWCNENGLLGTFFLQVQQITTYPRWRRDPAGHVLPHQTTYFRHLHRWRTTEERNESSDALAVPEAEKRVDTLVPPPLWYRSWQEPTVFVRDWAQGRLQQKPIGEVIRRYFAGAPNSYYDLPRPMSPEFWSAYGESVSDFLGHVSTFAESLRFLSHVRDTQRMSEAEGRNCGAAVELMLSYAADAGLGLYSRADGALGREWVAHSLVASFATMAVLDISEGLVSVCENCSRIFVSSAGRARFCSGTCRRTLLQREWRSRRK